MKRVIIESPYAGDRLRNIRYLQQCIRDCVLVHNESPYASHQMLTQALDDHNQVERRQGIDAGYAWWEAADMIVFYTDHGWSSGMRAAWKLVQDHNRRPDLKSIVFEIRALNGDPIPCPPETNIEQQSTKPSATPPLTESALSSSDPPRPF